MRAVVGVLLGLAIVAGGLGVYRWLSGDDDHARERAEAAAREIDRRCRQGCDVFRVERVSDRFWRLHMTYREQPVRCKMLDLDEYRVTNPGRDSLYAGGAVYGTDDTPCADDLWTGSDLSSRLEQSSWARKRKARFFSCVSKPRGEPNARRFGCRYSSPHGDGYVVIRTTGPDTFEIEATG